MTTTTAAHTPAAPSLLHPSLLPFYAAVDAALDARDAYKGRSKVERQRLQEAVWAAGDGLQEAVSALYAKAK